MSTLSATSRKGFELHRAVVQSANQTTGITQVKIPDLLGQQVVDVHWAGLEQVGGLYQTPLPGDMSLVAVSNDGTQIMWVLSADHSPIWNAIEAGVPATGTPGYYGAFSDYTSQTAAANTATVMTCNTVDAAN
jgi:hypothetical protein